MRFAKLLTASMLKKVCVYKEEKLEALRNDPGIIRNRLKIQAAVTNAQAFREIQKEYGSFSEYLWHWTEGSVIRETGKTSSELSDAISKDLKKHGHEICGNHGGFMLPAGRRRDLVA
mgnify:CR=1 FL=1